VLNSTGLIYQTFQSLVSKFEINPTRDIADILSHLYIGSIDIDEETWNKAVNQLRFDILPLLRQQINALPTLMNPLELEDDIDGPRLKLIVEIQSGLNQNSDQILSIVAGIKPELIASPRPPQADDSHLQELKEFRRQGLWYKLDSLKHQLRTIYERCAFTIRDLKKSTKAISHSHQTRQLNHRHEIIRRTINATESIDIFMKWLTSHEFINVQEEWDPEVSGLDDELAKLTKRIHRTINDPELQDDDLSSDVAILNKNIIPLAQSLIPVIKLSRLFFKKLMKDGLNKVPLKPFTDMNSYQLGTLVGSAGYIDCHLYDINNFIKKSDENDETDTAKSITEKIYQMIQDFDSNLLLVIIYIIPLIPNSIPSPRDLQDSLVAWNKLFLIAAHNCICAAHSYQALSESLETHDEE
jgi:hypothetical protein